MPKGTEKEREYAELIKTRHKWDDESDTSNLPFMTHMYDELFSEDEAESRHAKRNEEWERKMAEKARKTGERKEDEGRIGNDIR